MVQKLKKWSKFRLWTKLPKPKDFSGVARPIAVYGLWSESDWSEEAKSRRLSITLNKKRAIKLNTLRLVTTLYGLSCPHVQTLYRTGHACLYITDGSMA